MVSKSMLTRCLLLAAMALPVAVQAKTFVVDSGSDGSSLGTTPTAACPSTGTLKCTLRAAIETAQLASNTDTADSISIQVEGLVVTSALPDITKSLSFTGALPGSSNPAHIARLASVPSGTGATSRYCELASSNATGSYRLFKIKPVATSALTVSFSNLNLCFGEVTAASGAALTEDNLGGAIAAINSVPLVLNLTNVQLTDSHASVGGALAIYSGALTSLQITGGTLSRNISAGSGGAIFTQFIDNSKLTIDGSQFSGNQAASGGALLVSGTGKAQIAQIKNAVFDNNTATGGAGGAIRFAPAAASTLTLDNVRLLQNQAVLGGALYVDQAPHTVTITGSSFAGNEAVKLTGSDASGTGFGGAILANLQVPVDPKAPPTTPAGTLTIIASTLGPYFAGSAAVDAVPAAVDGNSADNGGGALYIGDAFLVLQRSFVVANSAPIGSALYFQAFSPARPASLAGNTIARNRQTGSDAGAYAIVANSADVFPASASMPFIGNIIAENLDAASVDKGCLTPITTTTTTTADNGGYNLFTDTHCASTAASVQNQFVSGATIFWSRSAGYVTTTAGGAIGGFASRGLLPTVLPLVSESPAIDRMKSSQVSTNNLNLDARGAAIADGDRDGNAFRDIGAYEFGARGLVGFLTNSTGGYTVIEPASGNSSITIPVKNFGTAATPTVSALVQTVGTSIAAQPTAIAPGTAQADISGTQRDYAPVPPAGVTLVPLSIAGGATDSTTSVVVHADSALDSDETVKLLLSGLVDVDYDAASRTTTSFCLQPGGTRYYPCVQETLTIFDPAGTTGSAINVSERAFAFTGSGTATYTIALRSVPDQNVTISLASSQPGVTALSNGSNTLSFPAHGTDLVRTVTVLVANDPGVDTSGAPIVFDAVISHTVTTSDPAYVGQAVAPVNVLVTGTGSNSTRGVNTGGGGGAFGWSTLLMLGSALLARRRRSR